MDEHERLLGDVISRHENVIELFESNPSVRALLNEKTPHVSLPTYSELVNVLCDVMDGLQDHDIQAYTGLPEEECEHIANVRARVLHLWMESML